MKKINIKTIGIIGGMGPQASARLLEVLISMTTKDFGINKPEDFPEIILDSVSVPNFVSNKKNSKFALEILKTRVKNMEVFNPSCFGIVCNTAHLLLNPLQSGTPIPFISIIDEVTKQVCNSEISKVGLLASPTTIKTGLYQRALTKRGIKIITPTKTQMKIIEEIILNVLCGATTEEDKNSLRIISKSLVRKGAQGLVLGCTELPLIFSWNIPLPVFDSIKILSNALLNKFFEKSN